VVSDTSELMPVCAWLNGEYGISGVYLGVPGRLGKGGVVEIVELGLSDKEVEELRAAGEAVRAKCADLANLPSA
jgi:malate dehydrogenase